MSADIAGAGCPTTSHDLAGEAGRGTMSARKQKIVNYHCYLIWWVVSRRAASAKSAVCGSCRDPGEPCPFDPGSIEPGARTDKADRLSGKVFDMNRDPRRDRGSSACFSGYQPQPESPQPSSPAEQSQSQPQPPCVWVAVSLMPTTSILKVRACPARG